MVLKKHSSLLNTIDRGTDVFLTICSFFLAYILSQKLSLYLSFGPIGPLDSYLWMLYIVIPVWAVRLPYYNLYGSLRKMSGSQLIANIGRVVLEAGIISGALIFLLKQQSMSRGFFLGFLSVNFTILATWKVLVRHVLHTLRKHGYNYREILIIGEDEDIINSVKTALTAKKEWGLRVRGVMRIDHAGQRIIGTLKDESFSGCINSIRDLLSSNVIDEIVLTSVPSGSEIAQELIHCSEVLGIPVRIILDFLPSTSFKKADLNKLGDHYALTLNTTHIDRDMALLKRGVDMIFATFGLIVTSMVFIPVALAIKLSSKGPIIFSQKRVGQNGREFFIYKFRTMTTDAESRKKDLLAKNELDGIMFKMKNDPRLIPCGKFLRKFSIDELPQMHNILKGDMSLIGPRPPTPDEVKKYEPWQRRRLSVKPGLSGHWQVSGRNDITEFDSVVKKDLEYIDKWSPWLEVKIILKTFGAVIFPRGAK